MTNVRADGAIEQTTEPPPEGFGGRLVVITRRARRPLMVMIGVWCAIVALTLVSWAAGWMLVAAAAAPLAVFLPLALVAAILQAAAEPPPRPLADRVDRMAAALKEAAGLVDDLQGEVQVRAQAVQQVRSHLERLEHLAGMKSEEAQLVAESFRLAVRAETRRSLSTNVAFMVGGAILGAVIQAVITAVA